MPLQAERWVHLWWSLLRLGCNLHLGQWCWQDQHLFSGTLPSFPRHGAQRNQREISSLCTFFLNHHTENNPNCPLAGCPGWSPSLEVFLSPKTKSETNPNRPLAGCLSWSPSLEEFLSLKTKSLMNHFVIKGGRLTVCQQRRAFF